MPAVLYNIAIILLYIITLKMFVFDCAEFHEWKQFVLGEYTGILVLEYETKPVE